LVENSEGAGTWRGGLGLRRDYCFPDHSVSFTVLSDRDRWGPHGLFGGDPAATARYLLNPGPAERALSSKTTIELEPGDVVSYRTCGGGGYGPPSQRDPELVLRDVRDRKVSLERAESAYKVAIDPETWQIDPLATRRLREEEE
jgi:N-methylhydantoinase B